VVFATDLDAERAVKIFNGWVTMPHSNINRLHLHPATNTTDAH
jgi:hypothetical protein